MTFSPETPNNKNVSEAKTPNNTSKDYTNANNNYTKQYAGPKGIIKEAGTFLKNEEAEVVKKTEQGIKKIEEEF